MSARATAKAAMEERILNTADRLFYRQGIRVVGVDTVAAEIGISKRTLYNYFPSKDDLIVAYLSRRLRPIEATDGPPAEQILEDFDRLERAMRKEGYRGCPFINAVAELADPTMPRTRLRSPIRKSAARYSANCLSNSTLPIQMPWRHSS